MNGFLASTLKTNLLQLLTSIFIYTRLMIDYSPHKSFHPFHNIHRRQYNEKTAANTFNTVCLTSPFHALKYETSNLNFKDINQKTHLRTLMKSRENRNKSSLPNSFPVCAPPWNHVPNLTRSRWYLHRYYTYRVL